MTTVFIWENHVFGIFDSKYPGHASVNISDTWPRDAFADNREHYVSWWPDNDATEVSHNKHSKAICRKNILMEILSHENYAPDHIMRLKPNTKQLQNMQDTWKSIRDNDSKWGEEIAKSKDKWERQKHFQGGPSYRYYAKNCSTVASRIVKAGFSGSWSMGEHSMIWTPVKVLNLAKSYKAIPLSWEKFVEELKAAETIDSTEATKLKAYKRRTANRGSSGAPSRFKSASKNWNIYGKKNGRNPDSGKNIGMMDQTHTLPKETSEELIQAYSGVLSHDHQKRKRSGDKD